MSTNTKELQAGDLTPTFTLPAILGDGSKGVVSLEETLKDVAAKGGKGVIIYFYPKAATPGCTTQACDFRDSLSSLTKSGYAVIGVSPDKEGALEKFHTNEHLTFPLASDPSKEVTAAFGAFGERNIMGVKSMGLLRSTFVVGTDGKLIIAERSVKATGHVKRIKEQLGIA